MGENSIPPEKVRLSNTRVEKMRPDPKRDRLVWDAIVPCFGVRVKPTGRRSYFVNYRYRGRQRRITIGDALIVPAEVARKEARTLLGRVAAGEDPSGDRHRQRAGQTFSEYARYFLVHHRTRRGRILKPKTHEEYERQLKLYVDPSLGSLPLDAIRATDIRRMMARLRDKPTTANRCLALVSSVLSDARRDELVDTNAASKVMRYAEGEQKRQRYLTREELARIGKAIHEASQSEHPTAVNFIQFLLLTGARKSEAQALRWEYIDWDLGAAHLPDSKTNRPKVIHLSTAAQAVLRALTPQREGVVFQGKNPGRPWIGIWRVWKRICDLAEVEDCRVHDVRRSFGTLGRSLGVSTDDVSDLLGHDSEEIKKVYQLLYDDVARDTNEKISGAMAEALGMAGPPR